MNRADAYKEKSMIRSCAYLQYIVNYHSVPNIGTPLQNLNLEFRGERFNLLCSKSIGTVSFSCFESDEDVNCQFLIFRGYKLGDRLPLPFARRLEELHNSLVNAQQFVAWKRARKEISACVDTSKNVIISGYSIGAAFAFFTSVFVTGLSPLIMFSPLLFCERKLFEELVIPSSFMILIDGDLVPSIYSCLFSLDNKNLIRIPSHKKYQTFFGYHNSRTILSSVLRHFETF